ncbi:sugar phosphate isomerase/epimerase family protein [Caproiciproducens sp. R1]|uniref:sugar phosphate isomerase/epimerase family protein n=1 Tax=Caproiciproducens sp. R1 TaxID=3435000 RepID=UPI0040332559
MNLAYPVAAPDSSVPLMGFTGSFETNLDFIRQAGYTGVELLVRDADDLDISRLESSLFKSGLTVVSFGTSPMLAQDKLDLLSEDEEIRERSFHRTLRMIKLASLFQAPVGIGKLRGNLQEGTGRTVKRRDKIFLKLCEYCEKTGGSIVMEAQKYDNVNNLNTIDESLEWLKQINSKRLKLLVDTFHMDLTEKNQFGSIRRAAGQIGFVHLSDTDRKAPGCGKIDFGSVLKAFSDIHYGGFFSMEIKQSPSSKEAAELSIKNLTSLAELI